MCGAQNVGQHWKRCKASKEASCMCDRCMSGSIGRTEEDEEKNEEEVMRMNARELEL